MSSRHSNRRGAPMRVVSRRRRIGNVSSLLAGPSAKMRTSAPTTPSCSGSIADSHVEGDRSITVVCDSASQVPTMDTRVDTLLSRMDEFVTVADKAKAALRTYRPESEPINAASEMQITELRTCRKRATNPKSRLGSVRKFIAVIVDLVIPRYDDANEFATETALATATSATQLITLSLSRIDEWSTVAKASTWQP